MSTLSRLVRTSIRLRWWDWVKILGAVGLIALAISLPVGIVLPPMVIAALLHTACDFTFQSPETAMRKSERGRHLLLHSLTAGALPLALAGLLGGNLIAVLVWAVIGAVGHYWVDWSRKFGLRSTLAGVLLDQASHLAVILAVIRTVPCISR